MVDGIGQDKNVQIGWDEDENQVIKMQELDNTSDFLYTVQAGHSRYTWARLSGEC